MHVVRVLCNVAEDTWTKHAFACGKIGCLRYYDIIQGYYTISESRIEGGTRTHVPCPNDGLPMYLCEFEPQGSVRMWMCAQFGCNGGKKTHGAAFMKELEEQPEA